MSNPWEGFQTGVWNTTINVDDFINLNYTPYDGDESFLAGPTERTKECNEKVKDLLVQERKNGGTLKVDASRIMRINAYDPGYIIEGKDLIVGLQTDEPLKRGICPAESRWLEKKLLNTVKNCRRTSTSCSTT